MADLQTVLRDPEDFPLLYKSANEASLTAQKRTLRAGKVRLGGLLIAAVGGVIAISAGGVNLGGLLALVAFVAALAAELYGAIAKPERTWYEGRAAAESVKTLTWRYVVHGESFEDASSADVDRKFLRELSDVLQDLGDLSLPGAVESGQQITTRMREARTLDFASRRALYLHGRIQDQQEWYSDKAAWNEKRAHAWLLVGISLESLEWSPAEWCTTDLSERVPPT